MKQPLALFYAATIVFLLLDYLFGINIRVAFLEPWPIARLIYYGICFACLSLVIWRPGWGAVAAALESLSAVVALTMSMAVRVMIVSDEMIDSGTGIVTGEEILNYLISGSVAYFAWYRASKSLSSSKIHLK
ncbi:MAG TPA: hypothetical protein PKH39_13265 [Woeseiaceae bacterium]|nr:hypothetical protein [Woeseiaceae bacterium]